MNELIKNVTPHTRGIIWLVSDESDVQNPRYKEIDYLLDGLLTANLKVTKAASSRVIIGSNFNHPLYVLVAQKIVANEVDSYLSLLKDLTKENDILLVDEVDGLNALKTHLTSLTSHLRIIQ